VSEVQLAQYGRLVFETRLVVEQSYATPQAVVEYNIDWCSNGVAVVRAFKEELAESKLAFQSQSSAAGEPSPRTLKASRATPG
jgi:hypothetical protein